MEKNFRPSVMFSTVVSNPPSLLVQSVGKLECVQKIFRQAEYLK